MPCFHSACIFRAPGYLSGSPVLLARCFANFTKTLSDALHYCNLDVERYKSHSFRIGAASWAAAKGMSDAQIRAFGRWKSNAFLRYIRTPSLGSES